MGLLNGWQPLRPVFPAVSRGLSLLPPGRGPSSHRMLPDTSSPEQGAGPRDSPEGWAAGRPAAVLAASRGLVEGRGWTDLALALPSSATLVADAALGVTATTDLLLLQLAVSFPGREPPQLEPQAYHEASPFPAALRVLHSTRANECLLLEHPPRAGIRHIHRRPLGWVGLS